MPSTCCQQVIWAILPTNMGHITDQYGPYYKPTPNPSPREGSLKALHKGYKSLYFP